MKQFKTRDSATAFLRKNGIKKEHYNNFITSDVVGGKPVFIVDTDDMETYLGCRETDEKLGTSLVEGNFDKENADGTIEKGTYYNDDGSVKKDPEPEEPEEPEEKEKKVATKKVKRTKKTVPLADSPLDKRARERLDAKEPKKVGGKRVKTQSQVVTREKVGKFEKLPRIMPTKGILKDYPDAPTNSIRGFIMYMILERLDDDTIFAAMLEVFGKEKCEGKRHYPHVYRKQLDAAGQLDSKGKPKKH